MLVDEGTSNAGYTYEFYSNQYFQPVHGYDKGNKKPYGLKYLATDHTHLDQFNDLGESINVMINDMVLQAWEDGVYIDRPVAKTRLVIPEGIPVDLLFVLEGTFLFEQALDRIAASLREVLNELDGQTQGRSRVGYALARSEAKDLGPPCFDLLQRLTGDSVELYEAAMSKIPPNITVGGASMQDFFYQGTHPGVGWEKVSQTER